jgi:hypothetical protein
LAVITLRWMSPADAGAPSCEIVDTWKLSR